MLNGRMGFGDVAFIVGVVVLSWIAVGAVAGAVYAGFHLVAAGLP
jgi:hypothetical protein